MEKNTVTIERVNAKLSCNHTVEVPSGQPVGAQVDCEKCPAKKDGQPPTRRIKRLPQATVEPTPTPAPQVEDEVTDIVEQARTAPETDEVPEGVEPGTPPAQVISLHGGPITQPDPTGDYDVTAATAEWQALKEWKANGSQGEPPATPNLTALNAAHEAGQPKPKKAKTSGRGRGPKLTDDELFELVKSAITEHGCRTAGGVDVHLYKTGNGSSWPRIKGLFQRAVAEGIELPPKAKKGGDQ